MRVKLQLVMCSDDGREEIVTDLVTLKKDSQRIEHLGLTLKEAKQLLTTIQKRLLQHQVDAFLDGCSTCPDCGVPLKAKGYHTRTFRTLILIEAPSPAHPCGMLRAAKPVSHTEETSMRFYTKQHPFYCGIDLHARTMSLCILDQAGETLLHRNMPATPEALLKAITPYRDQIVLAAACMFTWYWLADLCADHGIPFVLGHALYMKAMHGGKAKNDTIDAHKIAVLLRGGMLPQASVYPAEMRATRDLLRQRMHLARTRGALLAHVQNTNSQYNLPAIGKKSNGPVES